jgi:anti-anti-sigma factor
MQSPSTFEHWDGAPRGGIFIASSPDRTVVRLTGEIDLSMSEELGQLLLRLPTTTAEIVLDVSDLRFADCTLVSFVAEMEAHLPITLARPNRWVVELLRLAGVSDHVRIVKDI